MSFRVAQFNILGRRMAGCMWFHYARDFLPLPLAVEGPLEWSRKASFPRTLLWNPQEGHGRFYRFPVLLAEIRALNADVISMVELDCYNEFKSALAAEGYDSVFQGRPGKQDGCGIFWRRNVFSADGPQSHLVYQMPASDRIALAQPLRHRHSDGRLLVLSTHLYWDQSSGHQVSEARELIDFVQATKVGDPSVVLLGDLNTTPGSEAHTMLTETLQDSVKDYPEGAFTSLKPDAYYFAKPRGHYGAAAHDEWHCQYGRSEVIDYVLYDSQSLEVEQPPSIPVLPVKGSSSVSKVSRSRPPWGYWAGSWNLCDSVAAEFEVYKHDPNWVPKRVQGELQLGIPNRIHGSDHIPVACTLRFSSEAAPRKRQRKAA
mmetsp:Transcript_41674/g.89481  ORF Transcript_41674/g.89481 Transcript_41674/m.89481 type:complete len:373 (+) Transcript_41674:380-1498(+)|eukprot:CAMPEP_0206447556 /NCGR_PEP_ID=MMETSP0324_2-20121206/16884_1 /ASSEMBLY_ACC=CAM_ASM_000836 /TAXON_ID=2866 /ORGANISM="Crypthecodinium cohnii, Strain Seligo" /LENGTH=372 /DNA_ID=CAMNT_0053916405 /DNA_START=286 /DNA_END=1404 /DNA_ORIENTATION=+